MLVTPLYRAKPRKHCAGFTLIELMVTIVIVGIALTIAVPSMQNFQRSSAVSSNASNLAAILSSARAEAMSRVKTVKVVPKDGNNWASGVITFVDIARANTLIPSSDDITLLTQAGVPSYMTLTGPTQIVFDPSGFAQVNNGTFAGGTFSLTRSDLTGTELLRQTRRIKVQITGRVRICTPTGNSDSNCDSTTTSG